jgi:Tfp pilus assembly protein PilX
MFNRARHSSQTGFTLVVALLLLVALSLVGVAALRNVSLQERMAGNQYFRSISLDESRSTLRSVEQLYHKRFGADLSANIEPGTSGASNWSERLTAGAGSQAWVTQAAWSGKETVTTPLANGLNIRWTSDDVVGTAVKEEYLCDQGAESCMYRTVRQSVRVDDAATGAATAVQQHYRYINNEDTVSPAP